MEPGAVWEGIPMWKKERSDTQTSPFPQLQTSLSAAGMGLAFPGTGTPRGSIQGNQPCPAGIGEWGDASRRKSSSQPKSHCPSSSKGSPHPLPSLLPASPTKRMSPTGGCSIPGSQLKSKDLQRRSQRGHIIPNLLPPALPKDGSLGGEQPKTGHRASIPPLFRIRGFGSPLDHGTGVPQALPCAAGRQSPISSLNCL